MIKEYCVDDISMQDVILIEKKILSRYQEVICKYEKVFLPYKCRIELTECWTTGSFDNVSRIRPELENKYVYWIGYQVLYNENPVIYDDENSALERSYCTLMISKVRKCKKTKLLIKIFEDMEDVIEELMEDFNRVKQLFSENK